MTTIERRAPLEVLKARHSEPYLVEQMFAQVD
jgi:hypothetical protein